jgi:hypothetical protein
MSLITLIVVLIAVGVLLWLVGSANRDGLRDSGLALASAGRNGTPRRQHSRRTARKTDDPTLTTAG